MADADIVFVDPDNGMGAATDKHATCNNASAKTRPACVQSPVTESCGMNFRLRLAGLSRDLPALFKTPFVRQPGKEDASHSDWLGRTARGTPVLVGEAVPATASNPAKSFGKHCRLAA